MEKEFERIPGEHVWVMYANRAVCGCIKRVFWCKGISCVDFTSICRNEEYSVAVDEKHLITFKWNDMFSTKKELIDSL